MNLPTTNEQNKVGDVMEAVILKGDLAALTPIERVAYYNEVCRSVGLNPLTRPLEFIRLSGKETLYAKRDCADQLRKLNGISIRVVSAKDEDGMFIVHVKATDRSGREDEDYGIVALSDCVKGEARANAMLKAITKGKRRVTLSISGLGFLDETEVEDIPRTIRRPVPASNPMLSSPDKFSSQVDHLIENGTTSTSTNDTAPANGSDDTIAHNIKLCGTVNALANYFRGLSPDEQNKYRNTFTERRSEIEQR